MQASKAQSGESLGRRIVVLFVAAESLLLMGNLFVRICQRELSLPSMLVSGIAVASAVPMVLLAVLFFRLMRRDLDEMVQRVVLEGLAFAMVIFVPMAGLYVNAKTAGMIQWSPNPPELLLLPSIFVVLGILIAWRRVK